MTILCIYRAEEFSPNMADCDKAILDCVAEKLSLLGHQIEMQKEEMLKINNSESYSLILSMARRESSLRIIEESNIPAINSPSSIRIASCRTSIFAQGDCTSFPMWIKKNRGYSQHRDDVCFVSNSSEYDDAVFRMKQRGVDDLFVSSHVEGDLIKFYGVNRTSFFFYSYVSDTKHSKFGWEEINGSVKGYKFVEEELRKEATLISERTGIDVYGGDCVISRDGEIHIIDFNDWPSFASCREDASNAIVELVKCFLKTI